MDPRLKSTKELINYFNGLIAASTTVGAGSGRNCFARNACRGTGAEFPSNSSGENPPQYFNKQAENGLQSRFFNLANNNEIYHNKVALNEPQRFLSAKELIKFHESEFARESKTNGSSGSFGVKYSEDTYNIYVSNARSIVNKRSLWNIFSLKGILMLESSMK